MDGGKYMNEIIKEKIAQADVIVIGGGAGLSTAAGIDYGGDRFQTLFPDFINKYDLTDMYSSAFYPFETPEEQWAYWGRHTYHNRYNTKTNGLYERILDAVKDKEYFVLTTNGDHQFFTAGFDQDKIFACQGDYGYFQCSKGCHDTLYDNEEQIKQLVEQEKDCKVPSELVPYCPVCGEIMDMHLRKDDYFVENDGWRKRSESYSAFLTKHQNEKILFIEMGVGMNTPGIIKYPFWQLTHQLKDAFYVCLNKGMSYAPKEIVDRSLCLDVDINEVFS